MDFQIFLIFCLCACNYKVYSQLSYVRLQATSQVRYKIDKLVLACDPQNFASGDSISDIIIQKYSTTGWKDVVKVLSDISTGTLEQKVIWTDTNMQNRASVVTAIVTPTSQAGLQVEVSPVNVACLDEGTYRCEINGNRGSGGGYLDSQSSSVQVTMKVEPLTINPITVRPPQPENMYNPNTIITMTCYGDVGNPPEDLRWCIKRSGMDFSFTEYEDTRRIIQGTASMSDCQYRRTSTLTYNVSESIDQMDFRCETGGVTIQCGHTSAIAANFTLYRYKEKDPVFSTTENVYVPNAAVLSCSIAGDNSYAVRWFKDNKVVDLLDTARYYGGTSVIPDLVIKSLSKEDEGLYVCEVSDGVLTRRTDPVLLSLKDNNRSSTVRTVILSVLLSIMTVALTCVILFIAYNRYYVQKRDRVYEDTKDRRSVSEHAYDRTDYHMYDTSN